MLLQALFLVLCTINRLYSFRFTSITHHVRSNVQMISKVVGGSVVALVTPMDENNNINYSELKSLLTWHKTSGKY